MGKSSKRSSKRKEESDSDEYSDDESDEYSEESETSMTSASREKMKKKKELSSDEESESSAKSANSESDSSVSEKSNRDYSRVSAAAGLSAVSGVSGISGLSGLSVKKKKHKYPETHEPSVVSSAIPASKVVVPLKDAQEYDSNIDKIFEKNVRRNRKGDDDVSSKASSALPVEKISRNEKRKKNEDASGGGWAEWRSIIAEKKREKNSMMNVFSRALERFRQKYLIILCGTAVVFLALITIRPIFILKTQISRYDLPKIDHARLAFFTLFAGASLFMLLSYASFPVTSK